MASYIDEVDAGLMTYFAGMSDVFEVIEFDEGIDEFAHLLMESSNGSKPSPKFRRDHRQPYKEQLSNFLFSEISTTSVTSKSRYRSRRALVLSLEHALRTSKRHEARISVIFNASLDFIQSFLAAIVRLQSHIGMRSKLLQDNRVYAKAIAVPIVSEELLSFDSIEININFAIAFA